jgi:hypothetical protein
VAASAVAHEENLLQNPGFESDWFNQQFAQNRRFYLLQSSDVGLAEKDGRPDHWTTTAGAHLDAHVVRSGVRSLRLEGEGRLSQRLRWAGENFWEAGGSHYSGFLPLPGPAAKRLPRRKIAIGAWCKVESAGTAPRLSVSFSSETRQGFGVQPREAQTPLSRQVEFSHSPHDWQYREVLLAPGELPTAPHFCTVTLEGGGRDARVWFDDVSVREFVGNEEVNLLPHGSFDLQDAAGAPAGWTQPQLWTWFRNNYYNWTGWTHERETSWRGSVALDRLVRANGAASLRFQVFPGDNFAVSSRPVSLKGATLLEARAMVRTDNIKTIELMAQDETGQWLPQGDFLGDDMENNPGTYDMGTTGAGSNDWMCVRKYFVPRQQLRSVRVFLCARGFDGARVEKNLVGTVWWDSVQLYAHGTGSRPENTPGATVPALPFEADVDLGDRLFGKNVLTLKLRGRVPPGTTAAVSVTAPGGETNEATVAVQGGSISLPYRVPKLCVSAAEQYRLRLRIQAPGTAPASNVYAFGTPSKLLEVGSDHYYAYPEEKPQVYVRLNAAQPHTAELGKLQLLARAVDGQENELTSTSVWSALWAPQRTENLVDGSRALLLRLPLGARKLHTWDRPARDISLVARLFDTSGKQVATTSQDAALGFIQKPPAATFPAVIRSTAVDPRNYLRINDLPYFPVFWTPNFDRAHDGNYPPRLYGCPSADLNSDVANPTTLLARAAEARKHPRFFGYELGDGEMQLQGPGWRARLEQVKQAIVWLRAADSVHVINGPESWLIGHPEHNEVMRHFVPFFDVVGVETSFAEVPEPARHARPFQSAGRGCAVLAGLEAYYYQPPEMQRWRGYRALYEGCAGVGLCPSEMLRGRPALLTYLRGLNGEFRSLETVVPGPTPAEAVSCDAPGIQLFERTREGRRYIFAMSSPQQTTFPVRAHFRLPARPKQRDVQVLFETRSLLLSGFTFADVFRDRYSVHVYQVE